MNKQKWVILVVALALMGSTAGLLAHFRVSQKLGRPGVKTSAAPCPSGLQVDLPDKVLDYKAEALDVDELTLKTLPSDTSYGQKVYTAPDGFQTRLNVVLMGSDRSSLHKPQFCITGSGWRIDDLASVETKVRVERPYAYDLPIVKLITIREPTQGSQPLPVRGVYVYWYVADGAVSASKSGFQRMWWMARDMLRTGVLQRWAYINCFSVCEVGQEEATFERMKKFIAAAVPEFQLATGAPADTVAAQQ